MDKIEFKDCKIEDLKVGDVYQQEGTLANQSREPLLRVEEQPRLAEKYGLPHLLLKVVAENPLPNQYAGRMSRLIPLGAVVKCKVQEVPEDKVLAKFLRLGDIANYRCLGGPAKVVGLLERPDGLLEVTFEQGPVLIRLTTTKDEAVPVILPKPEKVEEVVHISGVHAVDVVVGDAIKCEYNPHNPEHYMVVSGVEHISNWPFGVKTVVLTLQPNGSSEQFRRSFDPKRVLNKRVVAKAQPKKQ